MRTREQLNKEYEKLDDKIQNLYWVFVSALISLGVVLIGLFLNPTLLFIGIIGMLLFGGYATYLSESKKELEREWKQNGYGLSKYPNIR